MAPDKSNPLDPTAILARAEQWIKMPPVLDEVGLTARLIRDLVACVRALQKHADIETERAEHYRNQWQAAEALVTSLREENAKLKDEVNLRSSQETR